ncbi:MAG: aminotransferase class III-fold pyridoxal phosphate-dependent enzyme [Flavobacteriaceae bacterium]|nr:aminotransferase class III-fold pyridoxal phosphate-dependent enzyme [Flavobacteriaceae bacterium]MDG1974159.1 aminotransferase class III-fold pyridoxal phosphate-dependent enzyme [Flavobacteriaceae bacterium]|tara:strand:+ start:803 stop:1930 length:1128 start_codon:yes stop_codon:yes gene_type:complete
MSLFKVYPLYEMTPSHAKGCYVFDKKGNKFLDLYGGHAVISIGHSHPNYVSSLSNQLNKIGFYSNYIINDLQEQVAKKLINQSNCEDYELFMCSSGAEANENALQIASFHNNKSRIIAFKNSFHGRSNAALSATDNQNIKTKLNTKIDVTFLKFNDKESLIKEVSKSDVSAIIFESIQGVGGLDEPDTEFVKFLRETCDKYDICLIADEVQSGFGRTGDFFAFQKHDIKPDIIPMAKGMGNGFPVGGVLINKKIKAKFGMLGTTFGGNHLACSAVLSVLDTIKQENLLKNSKNLGEYFKNKLSKIKSIKKIKGRGLMLGLEFDFDAKDLRKNLIFKHNIFTGGSANKKLLRILPPLNITEHHIDMLYNALTIELE